MYSFYTPALSHEYPLSNSEKNAFRVEPLPDPCDWIEQNIKLSSYYAKPGKIKLQKWQKGIIRYLVDPQWKQINIVGSTQTGKSFVVECALAYLINYKRTSFLVCYATEDTVEKTFSTRLRPLITENPVLSRYVKNPKDLTVSEMKMDSNIIVRTATAASRTSIASFQSKIVYGSEVSKYRSAEYDVVKLLKGRYGAHLDTGDYKLILESSPYEVGDPFYNEVYKLGTIILYPFTPCPYCKRHFVIKNDLIKELPNEKGVSDHNYNRIRVDEAAYLECPYCKAHIEENHHITMMDEVVWAAGPEDIDENGNLLKTYKGYAITLWFGRLVNWAYKFSDSLANYFEAYQSNNITSLYSYLQEDCAEFVSYKSKKLADSYLSTKQGGYNQFGKDAIYDNDIICALVGMDTQDDGYYYVIQGFCANMKQYILRAEFIDCDTKKAENQDMHNVYKKVYERIFLEKYLREDGSEIPIIFGLIDRGGHKPSEVDYICKRISVLHPYIGGTLGRKMALIEPSKTGSHFIGNTEMLSKLVEKWSQSDGWFIPDDIQPEFVRQFVAQYWEQTILKNGAKKEDWIHNVKPDHYRDCCNYIMGGAVYLQLERRLFEEKGIEQLKRIRPASAIPKNKPKPATKVQSNWINR